MPAVCTKDGIHFVEILTTNEAKAASELLKRGVAPTNLSDLRNGCCVGSVLNFATEHEAQLTNQLISSWT